ncbi:hypothetical protein TRFO_34433 [Tritrichomonas foetus]|uniref:Uncharacterized protein n=1 Tax=Tritrichomonas foetus TaxID=1144522 RepID=A0A1J4JJ38_9EUKA|nr:hypothetical protein TRFO_34433 [Tritrichomonas foetus]|eukprot:OHS99162.1 hypothetical protein TRFO_34433 [Tritrichomonas foetus]
MIPRNNVFTQSLPINSIISLTLKGRINTTIAVNSNDTISSIGSIIGDSYLQGQIYTEKCIHQYGEFNGQNDGESIADEQNEVRFIYNGQVLSPALSFAFYDISNNAEIYVIGSCPTNKNVMANNIKHRRNQKLNRNSCNLVNESLRENERVKKFFNEKLAGKINEPDIVLQRFQDAINPMTAHESARLTDLYRSRIEANTKSFRKLCHKYKMFTEAIEAKKCNQTFSMHSQLFQNNNCEMQNKHHQRRNQGMITILPEKPSLPSTDFLPPMSEVMPH